MTVMLPKKDAAAIREKVWRVIRGLPGGFTFDEVATITETPQSGVTTYLIMLANAGYIRQAGKRNDGPGRKKLVWRIAKNTGPKAPVPCRCIYDPNTDGVAAVVPPLKVRGEGGVMPKRSGGSHVA
jgi:hypothetical protein